MYVLLITRLLRLVGRWARKPVNHTSWVAVVTQTDRPKSVRNRCVIELFCGVVYVVTLPFWHFCWCMGFCHRTESDLFLFLLCLSNVSINLIWGLKNDKQCYIVYSNQPSVIDQTNLSPSHEDKFDWSMTWADLLDNITRLVISFIFFFHYDQTWNYFVNCCEQKRSTEGCSKFEWFLTLSG